MSQLAVYLTALIEVNVEIAVEVGRGLYLSAECVSIRCIFNGLDRGKYRNSCESWERVVFKCSVYPNSLYIQRS